MTNTRQTRRSFLRSAGLGAAASMTALSIHDSFHQAAAAQGEAPSHQRPLKLAMASYTLRKFPLDEALAMTQRVGLQAICLKAFHLPLDATKEEISKAAAKVKQAGIRLYGGGVIRMGKEEEVQRAFEYAKAAGMTKIIASPSVPMLPLINEKIQQYGIAVCIHNHGPGDNTFPTPDAAYEKIKRFDPRFGLCHDVGHTTRYGKDPAALTEQCADRILDVHMKDVSSATKSGRSIACGRGVIDIPALVRTFVKIGYKGYLSFEYEADSSDPLPGVAESVGYVRGVLDTL